MEGTVYNGDMEEEEQEKFWQLQQTMNNVTSRPIDYAECCVALGLDLEQPTFGKLILKPWQVTGTWWILWQMR